MTQEEHDMMREVRDWLMKPPISGQPSRAEQLDQLLSSVRAGKMGARVFLYMCGAVVAVIAAWNALKGGFQ